MIRVRLDKYAQHFDDVSVTKDNLVIEVTLRNTSTYKLLKEYTKQFKIRAAAEAYYCDITECSEFIGKPYSMTMMMAGA